MLNKENLRLVVAALRNGEFRQGFNRLKTIRYDGTAEHCCLGVACEIAIRHGVPLSTYHQDIGEGRESVFFGGGSCTLPSPVIEWLGLNDDEFALIHDGVTVMAVEANDSRRLDFSQIADGMELFYGLREDGDDTPGTD